METGDRVNTPHGSGVIVDIEHYSRIDGGTNYYGIKLDHNPFFFAPAPAYYWPRELVAQGTVTQT